MIDFVTSIFSTNGLLVGTIIPFLFVLTVVVFVHEMGHYLVGRWCGIGVKAFSIGFGPELFGVNDRHGTRWKLSAIPLGGYVKFLGDAGAASEPDTEKLEEIRKRTGLTFKIIGPQEEARLALIGCHNLIHPDASDVLVLDIGGGSTELSLVDAARARDAGLAIHYGQRFIRSVEVSC